MLTPLKSGSFSGDGGPSLGMTTTRRPIIRCEGFNGLDISSHETYVKGLLFSTASITAAVV